MKRNVENWWPIRFKQNIPNSFAPFINGMKLHISKASCDFTASFIFSMVVALTLCIFISYQDLAVKVIIHLWVWPCQKAIRFAFRWKSKDNFLIFSFLASRWRKQITLCHETIFFIMERSRQYGFVCLWFLLKALEHPCKIPRKKLIFLYNFPQLQKNSRMNGERKIIFEKKSFKNE